MRVEKAIRGRRSIRRYRPRLPKDMDIERILDAGRWAPSGLNNQPWQFVIIKNRSLKEKLSRLTESSGTVIAASALIAVLLDKKRVYNKTKDIQATGACIQNMLLEAHALGLGSCWLGEILNKESKVRRLLRIPAQYELMAVISLGWPLNRRRKGRRKNLKKIIYREYP